MKSAFLAILLLSAFTSSAIAQGTLVYRSDFSQGVNGGTIAPGVTLNWSTSGQNPSCSNPIQTATAPQDSRVFLGQFGEQYVALSLAGLPAHDSISITFNFYAINTWDGNLYPGYPGAAPDIFGLDVNGVDTLLYATFANNLNLSEYQTYPSNYPLHGGAPVNNFPETGAYSICQLDFPNPDWWGRIGPEDEDAEYHLTYTFANSGNTVLLNFLGDAMQEAPTTLGDESWGLDSIVVQTLFHQPVISYIIPDIGSPDMNTYVDIIGPYNTDTNFGIDSLYMNNPGDQVQVVCATPSDTQYIRFGPCMVSWNGRMISTQAYVMPWVQATSANWQNGIKIPIQVLLNGVASNIDTFYIVKPQPLGTLGVPGLIGSGGAYGIRSRRGAMIVDSLVLTGTGTYGVSTTDCDPKTPGNQGYLPLVIISNGPVRMDPGSKLDVSAAGANAGPGGGGGGNGLTCGMIAGNGFTGGGGNANWYSGCGDIPAGTGTGQNQNGLNGVLGGVSSTQNEGGGGGTGHPFGIGGGREETRYIQAEDRRAMGGDPEGRSLELLLDKAAAAELDMSIMEVTEVSGRMSSQVGNPMAMLRLPLWLVVLVAEAEM